MHRRATAKIPIVIARMVARMPFSRSARALPERPPAVAAVWIDAEGHVGGLGRSLDREQPAAFV